MQDHPLVNLPVNLELDLVVFFRPEKSGSRRMSNRDNAEARVVAIRRLSVVKSIGTVEGVV
jgi:hypothetical protein